MCQRKKRGSMGGLWKDIYHPLCRKTSLQFQHRSAFCCASVTTACSRQYLVLLPPALLPPPCMQHPRAHSVSWGGGIITGAGNCKQLHHFFGSRFGNGTRTISLDQPGCHFFVLIILVTALYDLLAKPSMWALPEVGVGISNSRCYPAWSR